MIRLRMVAALALLVQGCATMPAPASKADNCAPTAQFAFICDAAKPEDLARIPGTRWLIASGFSTGAGLKLVDMPRRSARLWYHGGPDQSAPDPALPDCDRPPDPALFTARGISLRVLSPGHARLLVVNHGGREAIEHFMVDFTRPDSAPLLRWQGCMRMPPGQVANSVASYADGTVLASVLTGPRTSITDFVQGRVTGGVYERAPGEDAFRLLPGTQLPGNNGLETARDDSGFYVVAFGLRQVLAYDRRATGQPLWRVTVPEFMPDNIHWDGERLILAGMVRDEPACGGVRRIVNGVADSMACHRGYAVAQLDLQTRTFALIAYGPPDPHFSGVSAAIVADNQLWLGSFQADRIAVRTLPYSLP